MILESLLIVALALFLDFTLGDPKNKYHPTAWIGKLVAKLVPFTKNNSQGLEKLGGIGSCLNCNVDCCIISCTFRNHT